MEDERAKEEKLMWLLGIIEAQIENANRGFMMATIYSFILGYFFLEALRSPGTVEGQWSRAIKNIERWVVEVMYNVINAE